MITFGRFEAEFFQGKSEGRKTIVLLHGYGANAQDLFGLRHIDRSGEWSWVSLNAPTMVPGTMGGRTWFGIERIMALVMQRGGRPQDLNEIEVPEMESVLADIKEALDPIRKGSDQLALLGFSQGGMLATHLAHEMSFDHVTLCSTGLVYANRLDGVTPHTAPVLVAHGEQDEIVPYASGVQLKDWVSEHTSGPVQMVSFTGGHGIPPQACDEWIKQLQRVGF